MRANAYVLVGLLSLAGGAGAVPTWPASTDELEEIMYQLHGFKARLFAEKITPCSNEASGPGRQNAAEWLRTAFHDMSTANTYFGLGGIDASLAFELANTENTGPGHNTTMQTFSDFVSPRSTMSDLIAAGVYASVRVCGGPVVPVKGGRVDATEAGSPGVPQPQNDIATFKNQFSRMGFSATEMIQVVACGHTLGGVHTPEFPALVPEGSAADGEGDLDTTDAAFDNKVVTEYVDGTTQNPLVVGPSVGLKQNSDFVVFNSDSNATMKALTDAAAFQSTCATVLQKMIEVVPAGVVLTDPITPYTVKPVGLQLTLNAGGATIALSGYIRVRTNGFAQAIPRITLDYKSRSGGTGGTTTAKLQDTGSGLDDDFNFYPVSANISASSGISSFTVTLTFADGTTQAADNNGNSFPISDAVMLQTPQSCLLQSSGALTVTAAVRNDRASLPANVTVYYQTPRSGVPLPKTNTASVALAQGDCVGAYTLYSAAYTIPGGRSYAAKLDIVSGSGSDVVSDPFKSASALAGTCAAFTGPSTCGNVSVSSAPPSSTTSAPSSSSSSVLSSSSPTTAATTTTTTLATSTRTSSSMGPSATLAHKATVGGYSLVSCWTEGTGVRALAGAAFAYDAMTLESCAGNCSGWAFWATEYGRECYCGGSLAESSKAAPLADCSMVCGGDALEYCGAGNRLELYSLAAASSSSLSTSAKPSSSVGSGGSSSSSSSAASPTSSSAISSSAASTTSSAAATSSPSTSTGAPSGSASSPASRPASSLSPSSPSVSSTTPALAHKPTVSAYALLGCYTEGAGVRALGAASTASGDGMTLEACAAFCAGRRYFATEYAAECYCGDALANSSSPAPLADCSMPCSGDPLEYCGAGDRLELYYDNATAGAGGPSQPASLAVGGVAGAYAWLGCRTEASSSRALSAASRAADDMTLEACAAFCAGARYAAVEYGRECYCGDAFAEGSVEAPASDCSMACAGDKEEYCGAGDRLSVYEKAGA